jgi:error-prone DNA polymerase
LQVTSHFSFLRGASSCEELFARPRLLGIEALAVSIAIRLPASFAPMRRRRTGVRLIVGCRLDLADGMSVLVYPTDRPAYSRLCRLLSLGKGGRARRKCHLEWDDLVAYGEGLIAVSGARRCRRDLRPSVCGGCARPSGSRLSGADPAPAAERPDAPLRTVQPRAAMRVPTVVTNDVLFHEPGRRILQDVVTASATTSPSTSSASGASVMPIAISSRPPKWRGCSRAIPRRWRARSRSPSAAASRSTSCAYQYPEESDDPGLTAQQALEKLTWEGRGEPLSRGCARQGDGKS